MAAIGWSGGWQAALTGGTSAPIANRQAVRSGNVTTPGTGSALTLQTGMERFRLYLKPGERIRTPLVEPDVLERRQPDDRAKQIPPFPARTPQPPARRQIRRIPLRFRVRAARPRALHRKRLPDRRDGYQRWHGGTSSSTSCRRYSG
ncbi:MAG: hypothetical protein ACLR8Y_00665 [Alistipes indistinctus]